MRPGEARPPELIRQLLSRLLPGPRGQEVLHDLDAEYLARRTRSGDVAARGWYLVQVLRPDTWRLAWLLRDARGAAGRSAREAYGSAVSLDLKLACRALVRTPGLTVVSVLGIALGTAVGVGFFVVLSGFLFPRIPLDEGHRLVALSAWDLEANRPAPPSVRDFVKWRDGMQSVQQVAAAWLAPRELVADDSPPRIVRAARLTAAGLQAARVPAHFGRTIVPEDEWEGDPPVAVLGHELWQSRFGGDPAVIGRTILVDGDRHVVVGVMPPGFRFPHSEELWTVLRPGAVGDADAGGLFVFGRLAPNATRERAQAELDAIASRASGAVSPNARLRPQVLPYTYPLDDMQPAKLWRAAQLQFMVTLLLIAIAVNIAILVYARTAARQGEIAVRAALGASRGRIVAQLCMEALVLTVIGTVLGLVLAHAALGQWQALSDPDGTAAFWRDWGLQSRSAAFALVLAVGTAAIIGVIPALKSTGQRITADLKSPGTGVSVRLGRGWTALIVVQVAVAVALLPTAAHLGYHEIRVGAIRPTFPAHEFLTAAIGVAGPVRTELTGEEYRSQAAARRTALLSELEERLESEPAVAGVTFEGRLPGRGSGLEIEGAAERRHVGSHTAGVAVDYFDVLGARMLAGRGHGPGDAGEAGGLVVSHAFVRRFLGDEPAVGRRLRFPAEPHAGQGIDDVASGPWLDIVGVVEDLHASAFDRELAPPVVYYAIVPGEIPAANMLVRVGRGDADAFAPRLRGIVEKNPDLRMGSLDNLATVRNSRYSALAITVLQLVLLTTLLLCAAGIHALASVTVTRRRKEIGIRAALGAGPGRLLASVFARALTQLGIGAAIGALFATALLAANGVAGHEAAILLGGVLLLVLASGTVAAVSPARRGLRIQPVDALRQD